jgi:hypothetical protein
MGGPAWEIRGQHPVQVQLPLVAYALVTAGARDHAAATISAVW